QPAERMLAYLAESPLCERFGTLVNALEIGGKADLAFDVRLPLISGQGKIQVGGTIHTQSNTLAYARLPAPIKHITGQLKFDSNGLYADALHGRLLGTPVTASIAPTNRNHLKLVAYLDLAM